MNKNNKMIRFPLIVSLLVLPVCAINNPDPEKNCSGGGGCKSDNKASDVSCTSDSAVPNDEECKKVDHPVGCKTPKSRKLKVTLNIYKKIGDKCIKKPAKTVDCWYKSCS